MALTAADVYRDYVTPGVPSSEFRPPVKAEIRALLAGYETSIGQLLEAAGFNPSDIPGQLITLTVTGGTANAIQADASPSLPAALATAFYLLKPSANNTGATSIQIDGGNTYQIKNVFGSALAADSLVVDTPQLLVFTAGEFRLILPANVDASAILADAQAAATSASTSAADAAAAGNSFYLTRADAIAATIPSGAQFIVLAGFYAEGDAPLALYKKLGGAPSPEYIWHFQSDDGAWWELCANPVWAEQLGAKPDANVTDDGVTENVSGTDNYDAIQGAIDYMRIVVGRGRAMIGAGQFRYTTSPLVYGGYGLGLTGQNYGGTWLWPTNITDDVAVVGTTDANTVGAVVNDGELSRLSIIGARVAGPAIGVDFTKFEGSVFDIVVQMKKSGAWCYYATGNNLGDGPYSNLFRGRIGGGASFNQIGVVLDALGANTGQTADGPNGNRFEFDHATALQYIADVRAGNGNRFGPISGESIFGSYYNLNQRTARVSATSISSATDNTVTKSGAGWTAGAFQSGAVLIGGAGNSDVRTILNNTTDTLTIEGVFSSVPVAGTNTIEIYDSKAIGNIIYANRGEGDASAGPNFITAHPGTAQTRVVGAYIGSLGAGKFVYDNSGTPSNHWFGDPSTIQKELTSIAANANLNVFNHFAAPRFAIRYLMIVLSTTSHGSGSTAKLSATLTAGSVTFGLEIPAGSKLGFAMCPAGMNDPISGFASQLNVNITTGSGFSGTPDASVIVGLYLDP